VATGDHVPARGHHHHRLRKAILVLVTLIALVALDWWQANREMDQLLDAVQLSERAIRDGNSRLESALQESDLASLDDSSGLVVPESERQAIIADARESLSRTSGSAAVNVQTAGAEVEDVLIFPWHRSLVEASDAYLDHNEAWREYLLAIAAEPSKMYDPALTSQIEATSRISRRRFDDALPLWPQYDAQQRVTRLFEE
jgi:hypothetical protein